MSYQICIINPRGATLRTGPSTSGGEIEKVAHGDVLDVERLIFTKPQAFDTNFIPAFVDAQRRGLVVGDVWCQIKGLQMYENDQVTGYVALRVVSVTYGVLVGMVEPQVPGRLNNLDARLAEIDEMIRLLTIRKSDLSARDR
jgi:hypothetical protein